MKAAFARSMAVATLILGVCAASPGGATAVGWQPFPLPPPPGGKLSVPAGYPGDLEFWTPNRGLMTVGGNAGVPEGIYSWDGVEWHQLATVCGSGADARIAWAGPTEFWTIARPSLPRFQGSGIALCHFKDGEVVGSYSAASGAADPYHRMFAAACLTPDDCWFGGVGAESPDGARVGAFHLHWDGTEVSTVYAPQGRAISDLLAFGGTLWESAHVGPAPSLSKAPILRDPEGAPVLLHRIEGGAFPNDPMVPTAIPGVALEGTELRAFDAAGGVAWAAGGGARSGPAAASGPVQRVPFAARLEATGWVEVPVHGDGFVLPEAFVDVAALPGGDAWMALSNFSTAAFEPKQGAGGLGNQPRVAFVAEDGATAVEQLAGEGDPVRGAAVRVACPAPDDCWLATALGYVYRWGDAGPYQRDTHPAFQGTITTRPNEAAEQVIADAPPVDDSLLNAPPVVIPPPAEPLPLCGVVHSALSRVKVGRPRALASTSAEPARSSRFLLAIRFRLSRKARVGLVARRSGRVVARARPRVLPPGRRRLVLRLRREAWPTAMRFQVKELALPKRRCERGGENTATTSALPR
jgi:hypothetical protein